MVGYLRFLLWMSWFIYGGMLAWAWYSEAFLGEGKLKYLERRE